MKSHLTDEELAALQSSPLSRKTPYLMQGVSIGVFSVARYYGGIRYNGQSYTYLPETDELIRDDVIKWLAKYRKGRKPKPAEMPRLEGLE